MLRLSLPSAIDTGNTPTLLLPVTHLPGTERAGFLLHPMNNRVVFNHRIIGATASFILFVYQLNPAVMKAFTKVSHA